MTAAANPTRGPARQVQCTTWWLPQLRTARWTVATRSLVRNSCQAILMDKRLKRCRRTHRDEIVRPRMPASVGPLTLAPSRVPGLLRSPRQCRSGAPADHRAVPPPSRARPWAGGAIWRPRRRCRTGASGCVARIAQRRRGGERNKAVSCPAMAFLARLDPSRDIKPVLCRRHHPRPRGERGLRDRRRGAGNFRRQRGRHRPRREPRRRSGPERVACAG